MTLTRRSLWWALLALFLLAIIVSGVWVATRRVKAEEARLASELIADVEDLARSVDPVLVGQLTLTPSDVGTAPHRRLTDLLSAYTLVKLDQRSFLVALRDGQLRLGPSVPAAGEKQPDIPAPVPDIAQYRAMERSGSTMIFGPGARDASGVVTALAPLISAASGAVVGAVGAQLPERLWQTDAMAAAWPPLLCALLASALLLTAAVSLDWRSRQPAEVQKRWLHLETVLTAVASVLVTAIVTAYALRVESRQREELFTAVARTRVAGVQAELGEIQSNLTSLARFFQSSDYVGREEFSGFVGPVTSGGLVAYEWAPLVSPDATQVFESVARQEGLAGFRVWQLDGAGQPQPSSGRAAFYPILYVAPLAGNEFTLGYDLGSDPVRSQALQRAAAEGLGSASEPLRLLQPGEPGWGMLLVEPVAQPDAQGQRGFVVAVLRWDRLLDASFASSSGSPDLVALDVVDLQPQDSDGPLLLASTDPGSNGARVSDSGGYRFVTDRPGRVVPVLAFGRALAIVYRPAEGFGSLQPLRNSPAAAVAGLSLGGILTLVVGVLRQRETTLQRMVAERTTALAEREAHYRALFEEALNPILVADADGRFVDANDAAQSYLQRTRAELIGKRLWDLAPRSSLQHASRSQTPFGLRRTIEADLQVGSQVKTLLLNIIPVRQGGRTTLFAIGQDITDRKESESALQRRYAFERSLAAASSRFVGDVSYDAAVNATLADVGTLTGASRAYLFTADEEGRSFGLTHEWCAPGIASQRRALDSLPGEGLARWTERLARGEVIVVPDVDAMETDAHPEQQSLKAHSIRSLVALPVFVQGTLRGFVGLDNVQSPGAWEAEDISLLGTFAEIVSSYLERVRAQEGRLELERQLLQAQKLESLGVLAGGIAHEFNNLLAAILGNLELARLDLAPDSRARMSLDESVNASIRAADLTRQMLAYSGKGHFVVSDLDLTALVEENSQMLRTAIPRTATLELNLSRDIPRVRGDASQLQQVVMNLLTNGADALGGGPGKVSVSTGSNRLTSKALAGSRAGQMLDPGEYVWLEVRDTGQGMDKETLARMFDPFYTTKETGRGLGLGAVLGIIRGHHGGIWVQSQPGSGTLVRVAFPALPRSPRTVRETPGAEEQGLSGGVLVIDDEESIRRVNSKVLQRMGLRTLVAASGDEAIALYKRHSDQIDCVLLDLTMPGMDGVATLEALRRENPAIKAVLCTGYGEQVATERFRDLGLSGFIQKPFQISELRAVLENVLFPN
ncbi:MAG: CHASE domain-containing protein [Anaerolineae bacterium]